MHYDPLRLGPCPKDLSEWTSLPPPQHTPHTTTQQAQQLVPHTRIRVPFPLPRHNIRPAQMMKTIRLMLTLVLMLVVSPLPPTTVLLSAFLHGSHLTPSHTHACSCPPQPDLRCSSALAPPGSERPHHDIRPLQDGTTRRCVTYGHMIIHGSEELRTVGCLAASVPASRPK